MVEEVVPLGQCDQCVAGRRRFWSGGSQHSFVSGNWYCWLDLPYYFSALPLVDCLEVV